MLLTITQRSVCAILCFIVVGIQAPLHGQEFYGEKWIGLHNMAFKDRTTTSDYQTQSWLVKETTREKRFSIGAHYRWFHKERNYHQLDLFAYNRETDDVVRLQTSLVQPDLFGRSGYVEERNAVRLGYRTGRMIPLKNRLVLDIAVAGYPNYLHSESIPFSEIASFPRKRTDWGVDLVLHTDLNFRIHKHINIGYQFVPINISYYRSKSIVENPVLTPRQQENVTYVSDLSYFNSLLDLRNITISYVVQLNPSKG